MEDRKAQKNKNISEDICCPMTEGAVSRVAANRPIGNLLPNMFPSCPKQINYSEVRLDLRWVSMRSDAFSAEKPRASLPRAHDSPVSMGIDGKHRRMVDHPSSST